MNAGNVTANETRLSSAPHASGAAGLRLFHTRHKLLLMAHSPQGQRRMRHQQQLVARMKQPQTGGAARVWRRR